MILDQIPWTNVIVNWFQAKNSQHNKNNENLIQKMIRKILGETASYEMQSTLQPSRPWLHFVR